MSLFTGSNGNLKFVSFLVRHPCIVIVVSLGMTMLLSGIAIYRAWTAEEYFIQTPRSDADLTHATAMHHHAWVLAQEQIGKSDEEEKEETVEQQTEGGGFIVFAFEAMGPNFFVESTLDKAMKIQRTLISTDMGYSNYCQRRKGIPSNSTLTDIEKCDYPVSPLNLFYPSSWNQTKVDKVIKVVTEMDNFSEKAKDVLVCLSSLEGQIRQMVGMASSSYYSGAVNDSILTPQVEAEAYNLIEQNCPYLSNVSLQDIGLVLGVVGDMPELIRTFDGTGELVNPTKVLELCATLLEIPTMRGFVDFFFEKTFNMENLQSKHTRMFIRYGLPLANFTDVPLNATTREKQDKVFNDWFQATYRDYLQDEIEDPEFKTYYIASSLMLDELLSVMQGDAMKALGSMAFVYGYVSFQTGSFFLAACGMVEIVLSLPLAYALYSLIFQFRFLGVFCAMCIYIVLAIGADDVFVFQDAYRQSAFEGPDVLKDFETRLSWVYRRAAGAMFITSFTTMAAFVATAVSPLASVQSFGIYAAFVIFADFVLVITFYPACVVIYHNRIEIMSSRSAQACCCCCCCIGHQETSTVRYSKAEQSPPQRQAEVFLSEKMGPFVTKYKYMIVIFFLIWTAINIVFAIQVEASQQADQFLPSDHPFQRMTDIQADYFGASSQDNFNELYFMWGVNGVNRDGVKLLYDAEFLGKPDWNTNFAFDEDAQLFMDDFCETTQQQAFVSRSTVDPIRGSYKCFIQDFKKWKIGNNQTFPVSKDVVAIELQEFLDQAVVRHDGGYETANSVYGRHIGLVNGELKFIIAEFESMLSKHIPYSRKRLESEYQTMENYIAEHNKEAPKSIGSMIQTDRSRFWIRMRSQEIYVISAITGAITGVCLAFVVILTATRCIRVAFFAAITIGGILVSVLAFMVGIGWQLGTIESINVTILAGFSVDYVVHLAHSYMVSKSETREKRVHDAIAEIGISVFSGMVTSVGASLMLFTCQLQFFAKFGGFLCSTIGFSWLWANFFFMGLLAILGPQGNQERKLPIYL